MGTGSFDRRSEEESEAQRHDRLYSELATRKSVLMAPSAWERFDDKPHPWRPYESLVRMLGNVRGKRILDAGCGDGWLSIILAKRGAYVEGFDISRSAISFAEQRAAVHDVADRCTFRMASAYELPYSDSFFDAVIGSALLHHLGDKVRFANELRRVMKPNSMAVFQEPFGNSLVLERLRTLLPVPSSSPDDPDQWKQQFKYKDTDAFQRDFLVDIQEYHLFSRLDRVISSSPVMTVLEKFDRFLLGALPFLRPYARTVLLRLRPR
jgi:2-polyprenyl-3-methyl-5-hydroxy-6-metoxy-1,4-benzoquinol methylase